MPPALPVDSLRSARASEARTLLSGGGAQQPSGLGHERGGKADSMSDPTQAAYPAHSPDIGQALAPVNGDKLAVRRMTEPEWRPPDEFEEYRLVRLLGRGTMGEVYLAHDSLLDRPVAVKFVRAARDPVARARFFDEARAIARLQHPNVVAIYRIAEVAGHPYLVSEYVRGRPLDQLDRPAPARQVLEIALDLARGLAAAHRCGVLHRDVKPANAILSDDGRAKLLDFGLASGVDAAADDEAPPRERFDIRAVGHLATIETTPSP